MLVHLRSLRGVHQLSQWDKWETVKKSYHQTHCTPSTHFPKRTKKTSIIMIHLLFVKSNSHSDADVDGLDAILELNECWIGILKDFEEFYQSS
ncbi:hypothetical protein L2E82_11845 [Cichorium intybus]|uniref:Uncharacterized protein n=1 Tax=Cichorium intybus TaxID=13427 RepID=A0ACB9GEF6_CICIN|nr:hypothetical protein L2E82_11845 [Cichorium intybus]